ncbi:hypothetical protein B5V02_38285 [Mesorhizobium kowhaii]|uniref:DUF1444 family protein n=2 Tax=Mesorhizobium kowhaii TaxID=1300272 RepID=A0A2W7C8Y9_9HYPH|nr:hypothetical protein B5V02_38285 [Mesorhizobium kowhaii]
MRGLAKYLGTLARTMVALVSLSGLAGTAHSEELKFEDVAALRAEVISRLKADHRIREAVPDPNDPARVNVIRAIAAENKPDILLDVTNLLGRIRGLSAADTETQIQRFINALVFANTASNFDPADLIANIRPREYIDALNQIQGEDDSGPVYEEFVGDLVILYQINSKDALSSMLWSSVGGRTLEKLRQIALDNINRKLSNIREDRLSDGVSTFIMEGDEAISPALILTEKFWSRVNFRFPEGAFVAIPRRDCIFVFDKRQPDATQIARKVIDMAFKDGADLLSEDIFERQDGKLQVVAE